MAANNLPLLTSPYFPHVFTQAIDRFVAHVMHEHDWRGIDTGRMCASCGKVEEADRG
jgi:hypothetical protein